MSLAVVFLITGLSFSLTGPCSDSEKHQSIKEGLQILRRCFDKAGRMDLEIFCKMI
jgi:hypothetical protein